jgi:hypothetical protein
MLAESAESIIKNTIEVFVNIEGDFNMSQLAASVWTKIEVLPSVSGAAVTLKSVLPTHYKKLTHAILRSAFLIELVKVPKIETTKFRVRWCEQLDNDPRWCSFDECLLIATDLFKALLDRLQEETFREALNLSFSCGLIPYETPIDYQCRYTQSGRIHERGNIVWYCDEITIRTLKLRHYLMDSTLSPDPTFFKKVLKDKIKVKTYLTDRVLTGHHKTNREKRWETHPQSVHFAERRTCMAIEYALTTEICAFEGFPRNFVEQLKHKGIISSEFTTALCPITGDALSYEAFHNGLLNPDHGRSDFQVGHLNPLKLGAIDTASAGHTAANISWISADGNRIQGSLSLNAVRKLIKRISENYTTHSWWPELTDLEDLEDLEELETQ